MCIQEVLLDNKFFANQIQWLKEKSPIYPLILLTKFRDELIMSTNIRKEHKGKWYLWLIVQRTIMGVDDLEYLLDRIMKESYNILILGRIDENLVHPITKEPLFILDSDQTPEPERLAKILKP